MVDQTDRTYWNLRCYEALTAIETRKLSTEQVMLFALAAETVLAANPGARRPSEKSPRLKVVT